MIMKACSFRFLYTEVVWTSHSGATKMTTKMLIRQSHGA
jgi:hypothetical protein